MDFPTTESDTMALLTRMLDGFLWHDEDFPHVNRMTLSGKRTVYVVARKNLAEAKANLRIQTKATEKKLSELVQIMKICLLKSEVDTASNPEKLTQIGWGPRTAPQPAQLPGQPVNLTIVSKDNQVVKLQWERSEDEQPVRNYIIERRNQTKEGFSIWSIVQISYSAKATLRNQPSGILLEYRIRAANIAGTGPASNTVSVIL